MEGSPEAPEEGRWRQLLKTVGRFVLEGLENLPGTYGLGHVMSRQAGEWPVAPAPPAEPKLPRSRRARRAFMQALDDPNAVDRFRDPDV